MYIEKLILSNFKKFDNTTFYLNQGISVLTGENNCGKSSVLDALMIWHECFFGALGLIEDGRAIKGRNENLEIGDISLYHQYVPHFQHYRTSTFEDILGLNPDDYVYISAVLNDENEKPCKIKFTISKGLGQLIRIDPGVDDLVRLNSLLKFTRREEVITKFSFSLSMPMINIANPREEFLSEPRYQNELIRGNSISWLKNRIFRAKRLGRLSRIEASLNRIFDEVNIKLIQDFQEDGLDENIDLQVAGLGEKLLDISLTGSGFLQVLNLVTDLHLFDPSSFRLFLMDEPDSHLHRKLQEEFLKTLRDFSNDSKFQIILTTHSISMIQSATPTEVFHIDSKDTECRPIALTSQNFVDKQGGQGATKKRIYNSLGIDSTRTLIDAIEAERIIFVEGPDDAQLLYDIGKRYEAQKINQTYFWILKGESDALLKLSYWKEILSQVGNEQSIWDKSRLVLDRDSLIEKERLELSDLIQNQIGIPCFMWDVYAIENIFFRDLSVLSTAISDLTTQNATVLINQAINDSYNVTELPEITDEYTKLERAFDGQRINKANNYSRLGNARFNNLIRSLKEDNSKEASDLLRKACKGEEWREYAKLKEPFANLARALNMDSTILLKHLAENMPPSTWDDIIRFIFA